MAPKSYHGRERAISEAIRPLKKTESKQLRRNRHSDSAALLQELKLVPIAREVFSQRLAVSGVQSLSQPSVSPIINYGTSAFPEVDTGRPIQ